MKEYKTKDFYLSALLLSNNFKLVGSERHDSKTIYFIFNNHDDNLLKQLLSDFININAIVNVKKFVIAQNAIRTELNKYIN